MTSINAEALFKACFSGDAAAVNRLLPGGTPRNLSGQRFHQFNADKTTPLMAAAGRGHTEIVRMILQRARNTPVDYANARGFTAQLLAVQYHHAGILSPLVGRGANVNLATRRGDTALNLAVSQIHEDDRPRDPDHDGARQAATVKVLLQLGASTLPPRPLPTQPSQPFYDLTFPSNKDPDYTLTRVLRLWSFLNSSIHHLPSQPPTTSTATA